MDPITLSVIVAKLRKYWFLVLGLLVIVVLAIAIPKLIESYGDTREEVGKVQEQNDVLKGVIENVQKADEAEIFILDANTIGKYCQCLRSARTDNNVCVRYLPEYYTNNGGPLPKCGQ